MPTGSSAILFPRARWCRFSSDLSVSHLFGGRVSVLTNVSAGRIVTGVVRVQARSVEASYLDADGEGVTTTFDRVDPGRIVRGLPVRDVQSRAGQRNYSGLFWSSTMGAHLGYESLLEQDRLLLADFDDGVQGIACQPLWLRGPDGPKTVNHVPDILLEHTDGAFTIVDVKPLFFLDDPRSLRSSIGRAGCAARAAGDTKCGAASITPRSPMFGF
jgi:hypothetical protein